VRKTASSTLPKGRRLLISLPLVALLLAACSPGTPANQYTSPPPTSQSSTPPPPSSTATGGGIASISFDDGTIGQYENARPVLKKHNVPGTYYIVSEALGWGSATVNPEQAKELLDEGNEIGNHTKDHLDLAKLSSAQATEQLAQAQDAIESQVGVRPTTCAYPYGSSNAAVLAAAEKLFEGCRSTQGGFNERGRLVTYDLYSYYIQRGTTAAQVREAAEQARSSNTWVVFVYHGVDPKLTGPDDVSPELFAEHVEAIVSTDIPVQTVESALAAMSK
jgi:peptidoglycan/xylan/chitin deacetylase (PgdA/CDA1 family)